MKLVIFITQISKSKFLRNYCVSPKFCIFGVKFQEISEFNFRKFLNACINLNFLSLS